MSDCGAGEDSGESLGLQGDQASQSQSRSTLHTHYGRGAAAGPRLRRLLTARPQEPWQGGNLSPEELEEVLPWGEAQRGSVSGLGGGGLRWREAGPLKLVPGLPSPQLEAPGSSFQYSLWYHRLLCVSEMQTQRGR